MTLQPSARLQRYLGRELIADPNLAIIEFVKNSYDAGAETVVVDFRLAEQPCSIRISDNGIGMDEAAFRSNWLRPGYSEKSTDFTGKSTTSTVNASAAQRAAAREPSGEKGLGRLAASRLGDVMDVWTRATASDPWLHVKFDWAAFDDMTLAMDEVPIPFDFTVEPDEPEFDVGTIVLVTHLRQRWTGRVAGRPTAGRSRTRLGRLKQDLEFLMQPRSAKSPDIQIDLRSDSYIEASDVGIVSPTMQQTTADYIFRFEIKLGRSKRPVIHRTLERLPEKAKELGLPTVQRWSALVVTDQISRDEHRPATLASGPIAGEFRYTPPPRAKRAKEIDAVAAGVLLYRDGVLVEPYGLDDDDWVGVEARKASRQGHAAIAPATFSGQVFISRHDNPSLQDMSNRLGLLEGDAADDLINNVRAEFAFFEELVYEEVVRPGWKPKAEQAAESARAAERLATIKLRATAHSIGQPLSAMGIEVLNLERIARRSDIPNDAAEEIRAVSERLESYITRMGVVVKRAVDAPDPTFAETNVRELIEQVVAEMTPIAEEREISLTTGLLVDVIAIIPRDLVFEALRELIANAIEADRSNNADGTIRLTIDRTVGRASEGIEVRIADDGVGIEGYVHGRPLSEVQSTKGRPAEGLVSMESAVRASRGRVMVETTGGAGTTFLVLLPRGTQAVPE